MAFYHRKLILDSVNITFLPCDLFCDPEKNESGYCPPPCIPICDSTCHPYPSLVPPPSPPIASNRHANKSPKLSPTFTISLAILATSLFIFFCYAIYKYLTDRSSSRRRSQINQTETTQIDFLDEDHGLVLDHPIWYIRTVGLQSAIINSIAVCKYKRGGGLVEGTECSVCLSEFQDDETLRLLPKCNHAFHIPCIDTWLRSHTNCPMCRAGIVASLPSPEQSIDNSGLEEETQVGISENNIEYGRETEDGAYDLRIGMEEEGELPNENTKEEAGVSDLSEVVVVQPVRRSVSMDSLSASTISLAIAQALPVQSDANSNNQLVKLNESNVGIVSIGRSLQKGPLSIERSLSCSGKFLWSRYSRSRNSVLPS